MLKRSCSEDYIKKQETTDNTISNFPRSKSALDILSSSSLSSPELTSESTFERFPDRMDVNYRHVVSNRRRQIGRYVLLVLVRQEERSDTCSVGGEDLENREMSDCGSRIGKANEPSP